MTVRELKTWPEFFWAVADGRKAFEVRRDDRGFAVGDLLVLREWQPVGDVTGYTGRTIVAAVTYLLDHDAFECVESGWVVFGIRVLR